SGAGVKELWSDLNEPEDKDGFQDEDGCPDPDNDGDGIPDDLDRCPLDPEDTDGFQDEDGCPDPDNDGDGIVDKVDACPNAPGPIENRGCPVVDSDGDGIPDYKDKCPTVPAPGTVDGCPPPKAVEPEAPKAEAPAAPRKLTLEGVNFDTNSARLRPESMTILDNAAATLNEWGEVKVEVAGHTDSTNTDAYNRKLSQRRAEAVRAYLVKKGVAADRLTAKGYGESRPVASNKTAAGRAKNRRVELIPQQ
ncbi:MAG TPA: OmpA family protein, partial [Thiobacillus sp.]